MPNGMQSITDNDHIYIMLKSEEHTQEAYISELNTVRQSRHATNKKAHDVKFRMSSLQERSIALESKLNERMNEMNSLIKQFAAMMTGNASFSFPVSLKEVLIGTLCVELEVQKQELVGTFTR